MAEVQVYIEPRVREVPAFTQVVDWEAYAASLRREMFEKVVFRGQAAEWRQAKGRVEWLGTIPGGPGYHIRKLRYEAVPGLWIPALLYEPEKLEGRVPVILNVNGHDSKGKAAPYKQIRCINQARRGMIALNTEWLGMGQLHTDGFNHYRMNQLDLCGTSGLAPFVLAMQRAIDVLLSHPHADPERLAVAGLSGGGWQTIFISALDTRVKLCNPVAGYSSFRTRVHFLEDLGDSEQTPCDMATVADYTHLTALLAPRPALLTFNAKDNCCFASGHALAPLLRAALPIYDLYRRPTYLRWHVNYDPGTHNFEQNNREAFYRMLGDYFFRDPHWDAAEIPCEDELKTAEQLEVPLPADNADFHKLALQLSRHLPHENALPDTPASWRRWQRNGHGTLRQIVRARHFQTTARTVGEGQLSGARTQIVQWVLRMDDAWSVPAVEFIPAQAPPNAEMVLLLGDQGRRALTNEVRRLLARKMRVMALDPFYFGESAISQRAHLFALTLAAVGDRPLGVQAAQVAAAARWWHQRVPDRPLRVSAVGPRTSTIAMVAAALEPDAISSLECTRPLGSLREVITNNWAVNQTPELFCFGLLERFDIRHLLALVTPRPITLGDVSEGAREALAETATWCKRMGGQWTWTSLAE